ncbi:tryptophan synthase subunit alpha [Anaerostipes sp.]|uniref:tryptophan synthase subunit alpha n=1 Tax=Anaerostipes sp. TaxID=1872530 RepID=UPI0025C4E188|nr:tryptophan synthase subunit alpha [Anaerostipes sp.]MBS7008946.1 tryptophan synthase subunit alpha [Anaerostipes sp.]
MRDLVLYMTAGYPDENTFFSILDIMDEEHVPVLELGIPAEDPFMDGDLIRQSHREALASGMDWRILESLLEKIRRRYNFRIILMTYREGIGRFCLSKLNTALYDGVLCVNDTLTISSGMKPVQIYNETMDESEIRDRLKENMNFAYVMSGSGKTGSFSCLPDRYIETVKLLKQMTKLPLYVGFGIRTPEDVKTVCSHGADGVIIGSHFMKVFRDGGIGKCKKYINSINNYLQKTTLQP